VTNFIDSRKTKPAEPKQEEDLPDFEVEYYTEEDELPKGEIL